MWCRNWALLLIYLRLTALQVKYMYNKIDETSNELNINPPIQLSKKTLFPNWITPNLLDTIWRKSLVCYLLKKQYELQNYFKNYSNRFTIWILNYRCFCASCAKIGQNSFTINPKAVLELESIKGFYLLEWVLVTSRLWVPVFRMV
jgi:hypothetical protein